MTTTIQKWGNSQGLRLAKSLLEEAHIRIGEEVEVLVKGGKIVVQPRSRQKRRIRIEDLVARMPRGTRPREESFGKPQGKEVW